MSDVVIVGGGPAGATLGLLLARAGIPALLVDRARFPRRKPCAEYLSPGVVRLLHQTGAGEQIGALAHGRLRGFVLTIGSATMRGTFGQAHGWGDAPTYGLGVSREEMDTILLRLARQAGVTVRESVQVTGVLRCGRRVVGVRARTALGDEDIRAEIVVGADGVRGVVGRRLGMTQPRRTMRRMGLVAHLSGVSGLGDYGEMHVIPGAYCGVAPLGEGLANIAMVMHPRQGEGIGVRPEGYFWEQLGRFPLLSQRVQHARLEGALLRTGALSQRAMRLVDDGVLLAGDAGGFYDPFTGQGIYKAIRSAQIAAPVIAAALRRGDTSRRGLLAYERERTRAFRGSFAVEWLVQRFVERPSLLEHAVRRLGRRESMADTLVGVTGDVLPARRVLNPFFLPRLAF